MAGALSGGPGYRAQTQLRPAITRPMLLFFIIGDILGGGIYALTGEVGAEVGGAIWVAFAVAGVVAAFTAASYAVLVGLVVIAVLAFVNFRGIRESVAFNLGCTTIELIGLALVVVIGAAFGFDGGGDPGRALDFKQGESGFLVAISGASLAFYALIGFEDSVNVAEETKAAPRTFPGTLFLGLGIAGVVYLLVTVIASMAVPTDRLAGSSGPLLEVVQLGPLSMSTKVFSAIALFALVNGALLNMVMASRLAYGMAQQRVIPPWFGRVHPVRRTPWAGIVLAAAVAGVLVIIGDLETLADTTVLLLLFAFVAVHVSVLVLRDRPVEHEHFTAWTGFPILGALCCVALIIQTLIEDTVIFAYAGGLMAFGLVLWLIARAFTGSSEELDPARLD